MVTRLRALTIVALLIALVGGLPGIAAPAKAAPRTVRVATHDIEPFEMSHDNLKSGFTIDILDQIALEVQQQVATTADRSFGGLVKLLGAPRIEPNVDDTLEKPCGVNRITYPITYFIAGSNPAASL